MKVRACAFLLLATACGSSSSTADAPPTADAKPAADAASPDARAADAPTPDAGSPVNAVVGLIGGSAMVVQDAIVHAQTGSGFELSGPASYVLMTTFPGACDKQGTSTGVPNGRLLIFGLGVIDSGGTSHPATELGAYTVTTSAPAPSTRAAEVFYEADGADCLKATNLQADSGTVTLTQTADGLSGTFDLKFATEHVTGSFGATSCGGLDVNRTPLNGCP